MEPVAILTTIIGLYNFSIKVYDYLQDVKSAPSDRRKYMHEATSLSALFLDLKDELEANTYTQAWFSAVKRLAEENGPFAQLKAALEQIVDKLTATGVKKFGQALVWNYVKDDISKAFSKIERIKSMIGLTLSQSHFKVLQVVHEEVKAIREDTTSIRDNFSSQQIAELLEWISPMDFTSQLKDNWKRYQASTGTWFLESSVFQDWVNTPGATLFCPGHPGTGKTIMSTLVIDYLQNKPDAPDAAVAYAFLTAKRKEQQNADALLPCILRQILSATRSTTAVGSLQRLQKLREQHINRRAVLNQHIITEELRIVCSDLSKVYVIIDGLDESTDPTITRLMTEINTLIADGCTCIHFMATSRHLPMIQQKFADVPTISIRATKEDVTTYLSAQVSYMSACVRTDEALQNQIIQGILKVAKGVFLIARLHLEALSAKRTVKAVKTAMRGFDGPLCAPSAGSTAAYDLAYEATMERIMAQHTEDSRLATRVLMWIVFSPSPLSVTELQHAMATEHGTVEFDQENIVDASELMSLCAGLVIIGTGDEKVYLAHYTAQEYFERTRRNWMSDPHRSLAETCLTYLSFDTFRYANVMYWPDASAQKGNRLKFKAPDRPQINSELDVDFPFYKHASCYWAFHIRNVECIDSIDNGEDFLSRFLSAPYAVKHANLRATGHAPMVHALETSMGLSPLDLAAVFGLPKLFRALIDDGDLIDLAKIESSTESESSQSAEPYGEMDAILSRPLRLAIRHGHIEVVSMILSLVSPYVNMLNYVGSWSPLMVAVANGRHKIVILLLNTGLINLSCSSWDPTHEDYDGVTPLLTAVDGHIHCNHFRDSEARLNIVETLLEAPGIVIHATNPRGNTALHIAARYGTPGVISLLLKHGLDHNARNLSGQTPLVIAAGLDHVEVVQLLVKLARQSATWKDVESRRILWHAVESKAKGVIDYFLQIEKLDVISTNARGCSLLMVLACNEDVANVKTLTQRGITLDFETNPSDAELFKDRAERSFQDAMELMITVAIEELKRDFIQGGKILLSSLEHRKFRGALVASVRLDPDMKDINGTTLLGHIAQKGHINLLRHCISLGGDFTACNRDGHSALRLAMIGRQVDTVRYILRLTPYDATAKDKQYHNILSLAQQMCELEMTADPASLPFWRSPEEEIVDLVLSVFGEQTQAIQETVGELDRWDGEFWGVDGQVDNPAGLLQEKDSLSGLLRSVREGDEGQSRRPEPGSLST